MTNMYRRNFKSTTCGIVAGALVCLAATYSQASDTYNDTRRLLSMLGGVQGMDAPLATLFQQGDERIKDLVQALDDPDQTVSRNAQVIIRYLGNDEGMSTLLSRHSKTGMYVLAGPVPLPLREWDYNFIQNSYLDKSNGWDNRAASYIYALALDNSPRAKVMLNEMVKSVARDKGSSVVKLALERAQASQPHKLLTGQENIAKLVQKNAFFIAPEDRQYLSTRVLGVNGAKDKALLEIHIDRGRLSEEWYHVVVRKYEQGWEFFSITRVAVS